MNGPADLEERFALRALRLKSGATRLENKRKGFRTKEQEMKKLCRLTQTIKKFCVKSPKLPFRIFGANLFMYNILKYNAINMKVVWHDTCKLKERLFAHLQFSK